MPKKSKKEEVGISYGELQIGNEIAQELFEEGADSSNWREKAEKLISGREKSGELDLTSNQREDLLDSIELELEGMQEQSEEAEEETGEKNKTREIDKVINIGRIPEYGRSGNSVMSDIFCHIKVDKEGILHITGVIGPTRGGNARGGAGQIYNTLKEGLNEIEFASGWNADRVRGFLRVWEEWHGNNMHAGDAHQRAWGWEEDGYDRHPSEPCPIDGYKFGTSWLKVELPEYIIEILNSYPESKKTPAWV